MTEEQSPLQQKCEELASRFSAEIVSVWLLEDDVLVLRAATGVARKLIGQALYMIGEGITGKVAADAQEYMIVGYDQLRADPKWIGKYDTSLWGKESRFRNLLASPIVSNRRVIGVVKVENYSQGTNDNILLQQWIAGNLSVFLTANRQYSHITDLFTDPVLEGAVVIPSPLIVFTIDQWEKLLREIALYPSSIHSLSPRKFEELIAQILDRQGFDVTLTGQTRDGGRDILAVKNSILGEHLFLVECKKYAPDNPVSIAVVRQLYGVIEADRATAGIICTTSHFTKDAQTFADNLRHRLSLKDYRDIESWLKSVLRR